MPARRAHGWNDGGPAGPPFFMKVRFGDHSPGPIVGRSRRQSLRSPEEREQSERGGVSVGEAGARCCLGAPLVVDAATARLDVERLDLNVWRTDMLKLRFHRPVHRWLLVVAVAGFLMVPVAAAMSGSSRGGVTPGPTSPSATDPFLITSIVKVAVVAVDLEKRTVAVRDLESEQLHEITVTEELEIKARRKKEFDGRRDLGIEDLEPGQMLRLKVRDADGALLHVRVEARSET